MNECPVGIRDLPPEKWLERNSNGLEVEIEVEQPEPPDKDRNERAE